MSKSIDASDVLSRLPHAAPFRFVSRMREFTPRSEGSAEWQVRGDEDFFLGHFPNEPIVPGVLIAEAAAQLAGCVAFADIELSKPARLTRVDVKFLDSVYPPATIILTARYVRALDSLHQLDVTAECDGKLVAKGSITLCEARETS